MWPVRSGPMRGWFKPLPLSANRDEEVRRGWLIDNAPINGLDPAPPLYAGMFLIGWNSFFLASETCGGAHIFYFFRNSWE